MDKGSVRRRVEPRRYSNGGAQGGAQGGGGPRRTGPNAPQNGGPPRQGGTGPKGRPMLLRLLALMTMFIVAAAALGLRLAQLQVDEASEWEARASRQQLASIPIAANRGNIYDTNMNLMAQSATVWTVEASPDVLVKNGKYLSASSAERNVARVAAREFATLLGLDEELLYENLSNEDKKYYKILAKVEKPLADQVREICKKYNIYGIYLTEDTKRYYPYETMASTVLGFVGNDNNGLEGIERQYEEVLSGTPGRTVILRNARGDEIPTGETGETYAAEDGHSIVLTLNSDIQRSLERNLQAAVEMYTPNQRGMAIAMDVNTGEILGLAVYPSYDPNSPYDILDAATLEALGLLPEGSEERAQLQGQARTLQWRNKALADTYEPGSVLKVVTAAAALDSGIYTQEDCFACGGAIEVEDKTMRCAGGTNHGTPTLRQALIDSCNVSFIRMSAGMGASTWYDYLRAFGLTEPTGVDLPGEPSQTAINNLIYGEKALGPVQLASCSFGQSNKYTMVQMITAISAAVNGGNLMQPYIVKQELDAVGNVVKSYDPVVKRQVISPETSALLCEIMEELVAETDNGQNAYLPGYRVGGKSGTSQKLDVITENEEDEVYISSFVGFAPADNPQIAVLLALDEPVDPTGLGTYFGGRLAAPWVRNVLKDAMGTMGVEPQYETDAELARQPVSTPKVTEMEVNAAVTLLNRNNLTYHIVGSGTTVVGQYPLAYTQIPYQGEVTLYTDASLPQETTTVPDLVGRTPANAVSLLKSLGLNVLTDGAPDDGNGVVVISQSIAADEVVPRGTMVVLVLENTTHVAD